MWLIVVTMLLGGLGSSMGNQCTEQMMLYGSSIASFPNMPLWAMKMFDSSTKFPEGILEGNQFNLGNFDECVNLRDVQTEKGNFDGKYCLATLVFTIRKDKVQEPPPSIKGLQLNAMNFRPVEQRNLAKLNFPQDAEATVLPVSIAICVPSTCSADEASFYYELVMGNFFPPSTSIVALEENCQTGKREVDSRAWGVIAFLIIFAVLVIFSTAYDFLVTNTEKRYPLVLSLSVYSNGKRIFDTTAAGESLGSINGIRFITIMWIMLGHHLETAASNFNNALEFLENVYDWRRLYFTNAFVAVDTFFMLSGLLVCYIFCRTVIRSNTFNIFLFYLHRYIRLTPAYGILILLSVTVIPYLATGPLWPKHRILSAFCYDNWWVNLLYVNNYVRSTEMCVGHCWFLSVDMQLYWCSLLLLIPLWKKPRLGVWRGLLYILIGLIIPFTITYIHNLKTSIVSMTLEGDANGLAEYYARYYGATECKIPAYVIGILVGYYLYTLKTSSKQVRLTKVQVVGAWVLSFGLMVAGLTSVYPMVQKDHEYSVVEASFFNALHRPLWSAGVGLVIILCTLGYGGFVDVFLSWKFFTPLSRLSYSIYLIHPFVQLMVLFSARSSQYGGDFTLMAQHFGVVVTTTLAAIVYTLFFEFPFIVIEKELLGNKKTSKKIENLKKLEDPEVTREPSPDLDKNEDDISVVVDHVDEKKEI